MSSWPPPPDQGPGSSPPRGPQPPSAPPPPPTTAWQAPPPPPPWGAQPPPGAWAAPAGYAPPGYAVPAANQLSLASMCLGIGGLAVSPCCSFLAFPIGVGALATGIIGLTQVRTEPQQTGKGQAIAGIVCGALAMVLPFLFIFLRIGLTSFPA